MTTSTPLFCRAALLRHHATGGTLPRSGHWSIGLLRASAGLLSRVLFRTTATTARAYLPARVGTRRSHPPSTLSRARAGEGPFRPETFSPNELATGLSPLDPLSVSASATLGPGTIRSSTSDGPNHFRSAGEHTSHSRRGRSIGEQHKPVRPDHWQRRQGYPTTAVALPTCCSMAWCRSFR